LPRVIFYSKPWAKKRAYLPVSPLKVLFSQTKHHRPTPEVRRNGGDDDACYYS
jgi:hypothetical protein